MSHTTLPPVAAIDLGATSGRVMIGEYRDGKMQLELVHRFANGPVALAQRCAGAPDDALMWDIDELWKQVRHGLCLAFAQRPNIASIGVDSWAVDYALLKDGKRLGEVRHYRDPRNERAVDALEENYSRADLFARNGLQFLPFNTVYQLEAERSTGNLQQADTLLLVPDYFNWLLTGELGIERTNASTTGLLGIESGTWDQDLSSYFGIQEMLPEIVEPGDLVGVLLPDLAAEFGATGPVQVLAVASHDTASAVAAAPLTSAKSVYISCGTWGLIGVELAAPVLGEETRKSGFTNEIGIDRSVRFLKNVTGTWLLSESIRHWNENGWNGEPFEGTLETLLPESEALPAPKILIDPQDDIFLAPGNMPERIIDAVLARSGEKPESPAEVIRLVIESLAASFAAQAFNAAGTAGFTPDAIHIVGGGSQGELLCQRTADYARLPVIAGPVECTALGNVVVQQRALSTDGWEPTIMRQLVRDSTQLSRYESVSLTVSE